MKKENILDEITNDFNQLSSSNNYSSNTVENENYLNDQYTGLANRLDLFEKTDYKYDLSPQPQDSYEEILEKYLVGHNEEIIEQEAALELYSELTGNVSTIGTFGNISVIKGKAKSKKTFLVNLIISSILKEGNGTLQIRGNLRNKKVVYVDTEQSKAHVYRSQKRITSEITSTDKIEMLSTFNFRELTPASRLNSIDVILKHPTEVGLVVIDGIKDLVTSINDEKESTNVSTKLLQWSTQYNCHIIVVLHENPSNDKLRGHLGTELTNKAETVIQVEVDRRNKDLSIVNAASCRNIPFDSFAIGVNQSGIPYIVEDHIISKNDTNKVALNEISDEKKKEILKRVYENNEVLSYGDLTERIKVVLDDKGFREIKVKGNNQIKTLILFYKDCDWIIQDRDRGPYRFNA